MLRVFVGAVQRTSRCLLAQPTVKSLALIKPIQNIPQISHFSTVQKFITPPLLSNPRIQDLGESITRSLTKFSWGKGKRKSVKAVLRRFYRLNWGGWIHTKCGRNKKLWKKHPARKRRLRQHVFCNATQSALLDKMVGPYWRKPKYYVDDPYQPYHSREEFITTYRKPRPYLS